MTLVDVLLVIVLLGLAAAALVTISSRLAAQSAQTLKTQQMLSLAQALLGEVRHQPLSYCNPPSSTACGALTAAMGPGSPLTGCQAAVALSAQALPGIAALDASGNPQVLRIAVTVTCPGSSPLVVEGWRVRHAPNAF